MKTICGSTWKKSLLGKFHSEKRTIGTILTTSGFRGWEQGADAPFSGIRPLADPFFKKLRKKMGQNGFIVILESSENQFVRPTKKGRQSFRVYLKIRPPHPRENPRSVPDSGKFCAARSFSLTTSTCRCDIIILCYFSQTKFL